MIKYLIYLYTFVTIVKCQCNVCSSVSYVACVTENSFQFCLNGNTIPNPDTPIISCPQGFNCVNTSVICSPNVKPACTSECGKCSTDRRFACLSQTTFALCLGTNSPSTVTGTCPEGTVCSINAAAFCIPVTNGETGSCLPNQEATTVAPTTPSPTNYCITYARNPGRYPVTGSSCRRYIYCYYYGNDLLGQQYECPGTTLFDPTRQQCTINYQCVV